MKSIKDFELYFFRNGSKSKSISGRKTNWISCYKPYLKKLAIEVEKSNNKIEPNIFIKTLTSYKEKSKSRLQCGIALKAFAEYINLELPQNWKDNSYGYGINNSQFRDIPSDDLIIEMSNLITNPKWKLVYGLMATYGLRNHEVFFCDLSSLIKGKDSVIRVLPTTKTGEHQVWPFHPEWINYFNLHELGKNKESLPKINTDLNTTTLQKVGRRVSEQFRRYNLPISPYDLRHAWALRTIHVGLPDTVSARMMGHSVNIHTRTYHHWITRRDQQEAVDKALARNNIN